MYIIKIIYFYFIFQSINNKIIDPKNILIKIDNFVTILIYKVLSKNIIHQQYIDKNGLKLDFSYFIAFFLS